MKTLKNCLLGLYLLLQSPSGWFAMLTLAAISWVTYKQPSVGGMAFSAFVAVIPGLLAWVEHKETLAQMSQNNVAVQVNLPDRGQL